MKCHVCEGGHVYLTDRMGHIKEHIQCPHCKGTHEEPFNAQTELAELNRRVAALEQTADAKAAPPVNHAERKMRDLIGFLDRIITRHERKLSALEERESPPKPTLPERPEVIKYLGAPGSCMLSPGEAKELHRYILALEKGCGR
jgi:hypothetical protein